MSGIGDCEKTAGHTLELGGDPDRQTVGQETNRASEFLGESKSYCAVCEDVRETQTYAKLLKSNLEFRRCMDCRTVFTDSSYEDFIEFELYDDYDWPESHYSFHESYLSGRVESKIRAFTGFDQQAKFRVLDIGCGQGSLIHGLSQRYPNAEFVGVDPSLPSSRRARNRYGIEVICDFFENVELPERSFDLVLIIGNFQLHRLPLDTLRKAGRLLSPDGILFFDYKNPDCTVRQLLRHMNLRRTYRLSASLETQKAKAFHGFRYAFAKNRMTDILATAGFIPLSVESSPPRLVFGSASQFYRGGHYRLIAKMLDYIDRVRGQRGWIDVVARPV